MAEFPPGGTGRQLADIGPGTLIGGYRVESLIGTGGMAMVFRARDERLGRTVALKVLVPMMTRDSEFRERFIRESRAAALVDHPNIIPVYGAGEDSGVLYLAMRHVHGGDLHSVVEREGPLPPRRALALVLPVASALDAAHRAGIVHRDVKPANILVDTGPGQPDHPYLSDFGLAKRDTASTMTGTGAFLGTAGFAAPEQINGRAAGTESDQYALACVVYTLLTARLPFGSSSPEAALWAQMSQPPPQVTPARPDLPAAVDRVIARALARNPADRFPDCTGFINALRRALDGTSLPGDAPPVRDSPPVPDGTAETPGPEPRRGRGHRIAAAAGTVLVAAAVVAGALLLRKPASPVSATAAAPSRPAVSAKPVVTLRPPTGGTTAPGGVVSMAFAAGGKLRDTLSRDEVANTYDLAAGRITNRTDLGPPFLNNALVTLDGQSVVAPLSGCAQGGAGGCDYQIVVYRTPPATEEVDANPGGPVSVGNVSMALTHGVPGRVQVENVLTQTPAATVDTPDHRPPASVAVSPDGATVAAVSPASGSTRRAYVWNTAAGGTPGQVLTVPGSLGVPRAIESSRTTVPLAVAGRTLAVGGSLVTNLYHLGTRNPVTPVPANLLALSPDGSIAATANQEHPSDVDLRDAATGQTLATLTAPGTEQDFPWSAVFSTDGRSAAVGYKDGVVRVWHLTGRPRG